MYGRRPPSMTSLELAGAICAVPPDLPVVLTIGYSEAARPAVENGYVVLSKLYGPETFTPFAERG